MTTATDQRPASVRPAVSLPPISLVRLTLVELRKQADTRAGLWLLILIALATVGTAVTLLGWAPDNELTFANFFAFGLVPSTILLPVIGILSMTGEWSQRTAVTTFALVPARLRVVFAKIAAGVVVALATTAATLALSAAANLLGMALGGDGRWKVHGSLIWQAILMEVLFVLMGLAFGGLLLSSPLAIVAFFALPTLWSILRESIHSLHRVAAWLDLGLTTSPLSEPSMTAGEYARLGVSSLLWVALPLTAGVFRILHKEVT